MNWFYSLSKRWWKKSFLIKMILLTSQLPYQQPNQLKPDTFNLSQEFLACVCSKRQSLRGRNLEDSRGEKRSRRPLIGGERRLHVAYHKCLVLNARSLRNKITELQSLLLLDSFDIACCNHWNLSSISDNELHLRGYEMFIWKTGKEREAEESCLRLNPTSLV